ncbi:MAG: DUF4349 domain-containing protein [Roseburia sp.]|nr:DUF4349 domain-containing protein [Roseburia sp.]
MKKRFYTLCIGVSMLLTSCGGESTSAVSSEPMYNGTYYDDYDYEMDYGVMQTANTSSYSSNQSTGTTTKKFNEQKLIRRVSIDLELETNENLESNADKIQQLAVATGGYVANVSLDNRSTWANGQLTLRIPKEEVDGFLSDVRELGIKVTSVSDSSEDVTMQYTDTKTRLEVQEEALKKYRQYLENAVDVNELLSIETKIDNIISEIESYKAKLRVMDSQIDYTEVNVNISCKTSISRDSFWVKAGARLKNIGDEIGDTFLDGLEWMLNAFVVLIFVIPVGFVVIRVFLFTIRGTWKISIGRLFKRKKKVDRVDTSDEG